MNISRMLDRYDENSRFYYVFAVCLIGLFAESVHSIVKLYAQIYSPNKTLSQELLHQLWKSEFFGER